VVSPREEDHRSFEAIVQRSTWRLHTASSIAEALRLLKTTAVSVILCEHDLPDGNWKDLLCAVTESKVPPRLIVMSADADERLWFEVLNLGGFDVLPTPVQASELFRVASLADRSWRDHVRSASESSLVATTSV
jgi:DNA-binding NtrC family response regulator